MLTDHAILLQQWHIGQVQVPNRLALAPMDGFSDSPFRKIARQYGAGLLFTEFVNAMDVVAFVQHAHEQMAFDETERPIGIQLFDDLPERLVEAAKIIERKYQPDFIDVNFSCPDRRVVRRGAGAALLAQPAKIQQMVHSLSQQIHLPITAKIRLGLDQNNHNYLEVSRRIAEGGAECISIHARSTDQGMNGPVNWNAIAEVKQAILIPVIGNGNVRSFQDAQSLQRQTKCDAIMIGKAAIGNPWIFSSNQDSEISRQEMKLTILDHLELSLKKYGPERGLLLFRKHFKQYSRAFSLDIKKLNKQLTCLDPNIFIASFMKDW